MCPKGDDPITFHNGYYTIQISTSVTEGVLSGYFLFYFQDQSFRFPAFYSSWSAQACQESFQNLPNIKKVNCTVMEYNSVSGAATYLVEIIKFPTLPYENNIYNHDGNPSVSDFYCNTRLANSSEVGAGIACNISSYNVSHTLPGNSIGLVLKIQFSNSFYRYRICILFKSRSVRFFNWYL